MISYFLYAIGVFVSLVLHFYLTVGVLVLAQDKDDTKLFRSERAWSSIEEKRAKGLAHRIRILVEKPRSFLVFLDPHKREFIHKFSGDRIQFAPLQSHKAWGAVTPNTQAADLYLAEAKTLYRLGAVEEALLLWKSLQAMQADKAKPRSLVQQSAQLATKKIQALQAQSSAFFRLDFVTDPIIYFNKKTKQTALHSKYHGMRLSLDGPWQMVRESKNKVFSRTEPLTTVVYLKKKNNKNQKNLGKEASLFFMLGLDDKLGPQYFYLSDYLRLWDQRRGLSHPQKRISHYERVGGKSKPSFCTEASTANPERKKKTKMQQSPDCEFFTFIVKKPHQRKQYISEFYYLSPEDGRGLFLSLRTPMAQGQDDLQETMLKLLKNLRLFSQPTDREKDL